MTNQKYVLLWDNEPCEELYTEKEIIDLVNNSREEFIKDKVDEDYIKNYFPNPIKNLTEAVKWLDDVDGTVVPIPKELGEVQRILKRLYENNGTIRGKMEIKQRQHDEQGYWLFEIKILDLNDILNAKVQLTCKKICPSGISDNGIKVVKHPLISLYEYDLGIENFVKTFLKRYFRYKLYEGSDYTVCHWEI